MKLAWVDAYRPELRGARCCVGRRARGGQDVLLRYPDAIGDGPRARTLPGVSPRSSRSGTTASVRYYGRRRDSRSASYQDRIDRKIQHAACAVPAPVVRTAPGRRWVLSRLARLPCGLRRGAGPSGEGRRHARLGMRVRGFPSARRGRQVNSSTAHDVNFVVEQNRSAQLRSLFMLDTRVPYREARVGPLSTRVPDERASRDRGRQGEAGESGMTYIAKPKVHHPGLQEERSFGLTRRDYEGAISTLCAGCGHDSITAAIIHAFWESGSSRPTKSRSYPASGCLRRRRPPYFLREAHGFNSVFHGRMPAAPTGAKRRHRRPIIYIGVWRRRFAVDRPRPAVPRDPPQREHALRHREQRRLRVDQGTVLRFSATPAPPARKGGGRNTMGPSTARLLAPHAGRDVRGTRSSGDKAQFLVPMLKAGLRLAALPSS